MTIFVSSKLSLCICVEMNHEEVTSKKFYIFLEKIKGSDAASFPGVCSIDIPVSQDMVQVITLLYDKELADGALIREPSKRSAGKDSNTVRFLCTSVTCAMYAISLLFSEHMVAHRVINF